MERSERWLAPGHNPVITDDSGYNWMFYIGIDTDVPDFNFEAYGSRVMFTDKILSEENGLPYAEDYKPGQRSLAGPDIE